MKSAPGLVIEPGWKTLRTSSVASTKASRAMAASVARTMRGSPIGRNARSPTQSAAIVRP